MIQPISSKHNPIIIKTSRLLRMAGERKTTGLAVLEGCKIVLETCYQVPQLLEYILISNDWLAQHATKLTGIKCRIYSVDKVVFDTISTLRQAEGLMAVIKKTVNKTMQIFQEFQQAILLDNLQSPQNIGAIVRNAVAFKFDAIFFTPGTADPFHPEALRAMAGNFWQVPMALLTEQNWLALLKVEPQFIVLTSQQGEPLTAFEPQMKNVFIVGSEGAGLKSPFLKDLTQVTRLTIPMLGQVESLNVAVSSGILGYHLANCLGNKPAPKA